jgi:hypothetical protein
MSAIRIRIKTIGALFGATAIVAALSATPAMAGSRAPAASNGTARPAVTVSPHIIGKHGCWDTPEGHNDVEIAWDIWAWTCDSFNGSGVIDWEIDGANHFHAGMWSGWVYYIDPRQPWLGKQNFPFSAGSDFGFPSINIIEISIKGWSSSKATSSGKPRLTR